MQVSRGPASASQRSPPALVPSSWVVRTQLDGRPAGAPAHSPVGEGNVCGPGARRASQAALVWEAELAARAARTVRAMAATKAATRAVAAVVQDALEAATTACPSADRRIALGVHASGRRAGRVTFRSRRTRPAGQRRRALPSLLFSCRAKVSLVGSPQMTNVIGEVFNRCGAKRSGASKQASKTSLLA